MKAWLEFLFGNANDGDGGNSVSVESFGKTV